MLKLIEWIDKRVLAEDALYSNLHDRLKEGLGREPTLQELKVFYLYIIGDTYEQAKWFVKGLKEE